jgi:hypothetical protein
MKLCIYGSRDFSDFDFLHEKATRFISEHNRDRDPVIIISGHARGADKLGEEFAKLNDYGLIIMPADWNAYGKSAGFRRNFDMVQKATHALGFWDGCSPGTRIMVELCRKFLPETSRCYTLPCPIMSPMEAFRDE